MQNTNGRTRSTWMSDGGDATAAKLEESTEADVCVLGAGIAGLTTACLVAEQGRSVIVLDDGPPLGGESSRTTGHLNDYPDDGLREIEDHHGTDGLKMYVESFTRAIGMIESLAEEAGVPESVVRIPGYVAVSEEGHGQAWLQEELNAAERIGYPLETIDRVPTPTGPDTRGLRIPDQGRLDAGVYLKGLLALARSRGVEVHGGTHVSSMQATTDGDGKPVRAETWMETSEGHRVNADWLVTATCSPVNPSLADLAAIHVRQAGYMTYALTLDATDADVEDASFSDTEDPYHYARIVETDGRQLLLVGGEDHKVGQHQSAEEGSTGEERFDRLEAWARSWWPEAGERVHAWSGEVFEPADGVGFVGPNPGAAGNSLIITGDSGQGLTTGTAGAMIVCDLILGKENPWAKVYDPKRMLRAVTADLLKENADALAHYGQWLTGGDAKSAEDIPPCGGATLREGMKKVCVHRDADGELHRFSAACPHQNAVLHWNPVEQTWDCPAHASRFTALGTPINGPAIGPMQPVD